MAGRFVEISFIFKIILRWWDKSKAGVKQKSYN